MPKPIFTPKLTHPTLCNTCRHVLKIEGQKLGESITYCHRHGEAITFVVTNCSDFDDKSQPSLYEMHKIAWRICADKPNSPAGFLSPQQFKAKVSEGKIKLTPLEEEHDY